MTLKVILVEHGGNLWGEVERERVTNKDWPLG